MRNALRDQFIKQNHGDHFELQALPADASTRRYFRLFHQGSSMMVMDAPTPLSIRPFIDVDLYLNQAGLTVPKIHATDEENGFMLLEDFGDQTFNRALASGRTEEDLYEMAMDALITLHKAYKNQPMLGLPSFDLERFLEGVKTFPDWYMPDLGAKAPTDGDYEAYLEAWRSVWSDLPVLDPMIVLRDFHIDNLMIVKREEEGASEMCGLLDFQDAVTGVAPYDLLSLLEDARRDIAPELRLKMLSLYFTHFEDMCQDSFFAWYHALAAQRHIRVAGLFVRLFRRDDKPVYLRHIPRVMNLLHAHLSQDRLYPVREWLEVHCPDFMEFSKLKSLQSQGVV